MLKAKVKDLQLDPSLEDLRAVADTLVERREPSKLLANAIATGFRAPIPPGLTLYPHQHVAVEFLELHDGRVLIADEMGTGKTISILSWLNLRQDIQRVVIVCKAIGRKNWSNEANKWLLGDKTVHFTTSTPTAYIEALDWLKQVSTRAIFIVNYDILHKYVDALKEFDPELVVLDEAHCCFPYNTIVLTDIGWCLIGDVVDHGFGSKVLSYNRHTKQVEWQPILERFRRLIGFSQKVCYNSINTLMRITHEHGHFICTANHKIWTGSCYRKAKDLSNNDCVYMVPKAFQNTQTRKNNRTTLLTQLRSTRGKLTPRSNSSTQSTSKTNPTTSLRALRQNIQTDGPLQCKKNGAFLWAQLRSKMENGETRTQGKMPGNNKEGPRSQNRNEEPRAGSQNAHKQPNGKSYYPRKDAAKPPRPNISRQRRKWNADRAAKNTSQSFEATNGICNRDSGCSYTVQKSATLLQSRYSRSSKEDCDRGRRQDAQTPKVEIFRPPQDRGLKRSRVVSVEILERGDFDRLTECTCKGSTVSGRVPVYNIEVANNNNYFANGALVSNCKNHSARRTGAALSICRDAASVICATGTPIYNRPIDIWKLIHLIDPVTFPEKMAFLRNYFDMEGAQGFFGLDLTHIKVKEPELLHIDLISSCMIRRLKSQVLTDLPPKVRSIIQLETDAHNRTKVRQAEKEIEKVLVAAKIIGKKHTAKDILDNMSAPCAQGNVFAYMKMLGEAKAPAAVEFIQDALEETVGKVVVFTRHHIVTDTLVKAFPGALVIDGRTPQDTDTRTPRNDRIAAFQNDPSKRLFIGSIDAAGDTITLTAANTVIFVEQYYTPFIMTQAEDRCHRIGQNNSVTVYTLVLDDSLDVTIGRSLIQKQEEADKILDKYASATWED